ncbi:hypothetical protein ZIOFF_002563 [Zingiber officinale]|uniref:Uncharacterized protein n=2 Tax=Zingiber officinale TaxID=94328 RepID=A0A8J5ILX6_ZINOF|nr:hypothetical protein ZIOFF_002563 [Zingiber officinale]
MAHLSISALANAFLFPKSHLLLSSHPAPAPTTRRRITKPGQIHAKMGGETKPGKKKFITREEEPDQ